jgi:hypothetical protein
MFGSPALFRPRTGNRQSRRCESCAIEPTLELRYGISEDAAKLLEWIEGLREKDFLGKWTPIVEEQLEKKIGIQCPWDSANLPAYLAELLSELNDHIPYELSLQPWKSYSEYKHRIRVSQKKSDEAVLIQQIHLLALKRGKTVQVERIREWISQILN